MIRPVIRMGDPLLLRVAAAVPEADFGTPALVALARDMLETMIEQNGAGLAAPQVAVSLRVMVFGRGDVPNPRYPGTPGIPPTVLCNPVVTPASLEMEDSWEGCLSIPGLRGLVPRFKHIRYKGFDEYGKPVEREASDFHARLVQHEMDHLEGILYPKRMRDMTRFGFIDELEAADWLA